MSARKRGINRLTIRKLSKFINLSQGILEIDPIPKRILAVTSRENEKAIILLLKFNFKKIRKLNDDEVEFELL